MFYDTGCYGRVTVGGLPPEVERLLVSVPAEWLEFDADDDAIVVRHVEPTESPPLPTVAGELVRMISEIPVEHRGAIAGGDLFVHTERSAQLVRLRVEAGGALHVEWARPDYARARRRPYARGGEPLVDARVQRLDGSVSFASSDPGSAARALQACADDFEGLYPEGECSVETSPDGGVRAELRGLNLDVDLLLETALRHAEPGSLEARVEVSSFANEPPERFARLVAEGGSLFIQRPLLWSSDT